MTQALTALRESVRKVLISKVENISGELTKICTPKFDPQATINVSDLDGASKFTTKTTVGAPTAAEVRAFAASSNPTVREQLLKFEQHRLNDYAGLARDIGKLVWDRAWNEITLDAFTLLFALRTTAHPENGVSGSPYAATGGGTVYAADAYDMTWLDGTTGSQTSDHTLALSSANLSTVLAKGRTYKDRSGKARNKTSRPKLVVVPELETLAKDLVAQSGRLYDGSGLQSGMAGRISEVIVAPAGASAAADAWVVVWVDEMTTESGAMELQGPILSHIRKLPQVKIGIPTDASDIHVYGDFEYDNFLHPFVDGNAFYSEP